MNLESLGLESQGEEVQLVLGLGLGLDFEGKEEPFLRHDNDSQFLHSAMNLKSVCLSRLNLTLRR